MFGDNSLAFNAMLLHIQKPGLTYAASAYDWATRFERIIKEDAHPLLILWPFGPGAFVYDVQDTEGKPLPDDMVQTFHASGPITAERLSTYIKRLASEGIYAKQVNVGDVSNYVSAGTSLADLDLYAITRATRHIEDELGIAAHRLFEPRKKDNCA